MNPQEKLLHGFHCFCEEIARSPAPSLRKFPLGSGPLEHKAVQSTWGSAEGGTAPKDEMQLLESEQRYVAPSNAVSGSLGQRSHVFTTCNK